MRAVAEKPALQTDCRRSGDAYFAKSSKVLPPSIAALSQYGFGPMPLQVWPASSLYSLFEGALFVFFDAGTTGVADVAVEVAVP